MPRLYLVFASLATSSTIPDTRWQEQASLKIHDDALSVVQHNVQEHVHQIQPNEGLAPTPEFDKNAKSRNLASALVSHAVKRVFMGFFQMMVGNLKQVSGWLYEPTSPSVQEEASCSQGDREQLQTAIEALAMPLGQALVTEDHDMKMPILPFKDNCILEKFLEGGVINYSATDVCIQKSLNLSASCSSCQISFYKAFAGTGLYELGCMPKCMPLENKCAGNDIETKNCYQAVAGCIECVRPAWKELIKCVGVQNQAKIMHKSEDCISRLKDGTYHSRHRVPGAVGFFGKCLFAAHH